MSNIQTTSSLRGRTLKLLLLFILCVFSAISLGGNRTHNGNTIFTPTSEMLISDWSDQTEMERVWQASIVTIPLPDSRHKRYTISGLEKDAIPAEVKFPTIVFLHGCAGIWEGTYRRIEIFANNGFAVIVPVSFARKKYPKSCDVVDRTRGLYRGTIFLRRNDVGYAIRKARELAWVDERNIFLVGHSEGAALAATFNDTEVSVNARIVESWTCNSGWGEYRGVNAPSDEPVLTLLGQNDPWYRNHWSIGSCEEYLDSTNGSRSVVFTQAGIRDRHELLEVKAVQEIVLNFLARHRK